MDEIDFVITDSEDEVVISNDENIRNKKEDLIANGNDDVRLEADSNEASDSESSLSENEALFNGFVPTKNGFPNISDDQSNENGVLMNNDGNDLKSRTPDKCWVCEIVDAKYKCPKCLIKTCSVACVKLHKKQESCDGIRCKTAYIAKENFKESNFMSDYHFLEEVNRCATKVDNNDSKNQKLSGMKFKTYKSKQMNIDLRFLPYSFTRHKQNTTFYCKKKRQFLWRVEWVFVDIKTTIYERQLSETIPLNDAVQKYIDVKADSEFYDARLDKYCGETLRFYMKKVDQPANDVRYFKLDGKFGLKSNLESKVVFEFPQVFVSLGNCSEFENKLFEK